MPNGTDISKFLASLDKEVLPRATAAAIKATDKFGEMVLNRAQNLAPISPPNKYVPGVRKEEILNPLYTGHSGHLKASATAERARLEGTQIVKTIGFNTVYAARQHEELTWHHTQGEAKYLEKALRQSLPQFGPYLMAEMNKVL